MRAHTFRLSMKTRLTHEIRLRRCCSVLICSHLVWPVGRVGMAWHGMIHMTCEKAKPLVRYRGVQPLPVFPSLRITDTYHDDGAGQF